MRYMWTSIIFLLSVFCFSLEISFFLFYCTMFQNHVPIPARPNPKKWRHKNNPGATGGIPPDTDSCEWWRAWRLAEGQSSFLLQWNRVSKSGVNILLLYSLARLVRMAPKINEAPATQEQSVSSQKALTHPGSDLKNSGRHESPSGITSLLPGLGAQPRWPVRHLLPGVHRSIVWGWRFFFSSFLREEGTYLVYFQTPLHLMHDRLAFAVKAENYKEGLIDPPVSENACLVVSNWPSRYLWNNEWIFRR